MKRYIQAAAFGGSLLAVAVYGCVCSIAHTCDTDLDCPDTTACREGACVFLGGPPDPDEDGGIESSDAGPDAGHDAGVPDGGTPDSGEPDAGEEPDAGFEDAGEPEDAGPEDAGEPDAGEEPDAGPQDAGFADGGFDDAGSPASCDPATGFPPEDPPPDLVTLEDSDFDTNDDKLVFRPEGFPLFCPSDGSCEDGACEVFRTSDVHVVTDNGFLDDTLDGNDLVSPDADGKFRIPFLDPTFDQPGFFFIGTLVSSVSDDGSTPVAPDAYRDGTGFVEFDLFVFCAPGGNTLCERRVGPPVFYRVEVGWDQAQDLLTPQGNGSPE